MTSSERPYEYLLGDSSTEAARLRAQAALWDPVSHALFDRLHIQQHSKVLEIGPGAGSLHRELCARAAIVDAVERSPTFAAQLQSTGHVWQMNLIDVPLPDAHYDVIFARWVFLFLPHPLEHVRKLVRALKPGGRLAIQDYHRETLDMVPRPPDWAALLEADRAFFASEGGDASIGSKLPALFVEAGLGQLETAAHLTCGHPGSATWAWLSSYFLGVLDRYHFDSKSLRAHWLACAERPSSLLFGPTVLDVVGTKP